jgi:hypothetical protein
LLAGFLYGFGMAKITKKTKPAPNYSIKGRKARLDASQNALRVVEQAIGGKLVESNPRSSR